MHQILINKGDFKVKKVDGLTVIETNKEVSLGFSEEAVTELKAALVTDKPKSFSMCDLYDYEKNAAKDTEMISQFINRSKNEEY